jgi:hypothetical protein
MRRDVGTGHLELPDHYSPDEVARSKAGRLSRVGYDGGTGAVERQAIRRRALRLVPEAW